MSESVTVDRLQRNRMPQFRLGPISFEVAAGGRLAVVGPSGSGKTTLLRCLAGLERPDAGSIKIGDQVVDQGATHVAPDRRQVGLVFQDGALWPNMTALQHLTFAAPGLSKADAMQLLDQAGLAEHHRKRPGALSGGEAQRLGLVRALAPKPAVLLLDEPLRSVDVHQRDGLVLLLRSLCDERNVTTILVTHDRDEALALATDLVVLRRGHMVERGSAVELLAHPRTAFAAAFLRGAACLPTTLNNGRLETLFGKFNRPPGAPDDLRLVVFPGEVEADDEAEGPEARVLAVVPDEFGLRLRVACEGQLLIARTAARPVGTSTRLRLTTPPRLLPWQEHPDSDRRP